jgi:hypothetical protein
VASTVGVVAHSVGIGELSISIKMPTSRSAHLAVDHNVSHESALAKEEEEEEEILRNAKTRRNLYEEILRIDRIIAIQF